ncbi:MAG: aldo/keto reductase [Vallitaleaceae bacterium]|nr:aldo/keto reductase [Vallitaleaceae bacterium]
MEKIKVFEENLSRIAFGGVIVMGEEQKDADRYVAEAIEMGVNYFDVAPTYGDAELKLGPALYGKRDQVFLACKTEDRTKAGAQALLTSSLKNLKTDYFYLYQLHAVYNLEDVEQIFGPDGAFEVFSEAKKQGIIKRIGFSAHSTEAALALMERYDFDSIMFPFNFVSMIKSGYGMHVLKKAKEKNMTVLGIKSMALSEHKTTDTVDHPKAWYHPIEDFDTARKAVSYAVSQGVDIIIPPGDFESFKWAVKIAEGGLSLSDKDISDLKEIAAGTVPLFPLKAR